MTNINKSFVFYSFSHKGQEFLERVNDATVHRNSQHDDSKQNRHKKLKGLCKTKWVVRFEAIDNLWIYRHMYSCAATFWSILICMLKKSAAWSSGTARGFYIRRREFVCVWPRMTRILQSKYLRGAVDSKIASSFPHHLHLFVRFKFVVGLKILSWLGTTSNRSTIDLR